MKKINDVDGNWDETKKRLVQKFAILSESDFVLREGNHRELMDRLQRKLGKTKEEIRKIVSELFTVKTPDRLD